MKRTLLTLLAPAAALMSLACSSSAGRPTAPPPAAPAPAVSPTPAPLSRINPDVIEETETYVILRLPKSQYIRVDERRVRHPVVGPPIEYFREDEKYYYVHTPKKIAEEEALKRQLREQLPEGAAPARGPSPPLVSKVPLSDFEDLTPPRVAGRARLVPVADPGLPDRGMWRHSFVLTDMNGDERPDIVSPPARISGEPRLHIWLGDGRGHFTPWKLDYRQEGSTRPEANIGYGGVAVADIDGDGHQDVVAAFHGGGLASFFGDGKGNFRVERKGLPARDFSAQAVALADANGDGKPDLVASRDVVDQSLQSSVDKSQVRVYLYKGGDGWELHRDGIVGGFYSNSLHAWDYDGDARKDVLTASHYVGALTLLWKNEGNGSFSPVSFPEIEIYAYHFASAPGTFGKERVPAFADNYYMYTNAPKVAKATGISVYAFRNGAWTRHRVWRKKEGKSLQYALALADLDGDGLDDVLFPDTAQRRLRVFFQEADGSFREMAETEEPVLDSFGQCVRVADLDGDGRADVVVSKTVSSTTPDDRGGWSVYLNKR